MTKQEFEKQLHESLEKNKSEISKNLDRLIQNLTDKITGIGIGIFPSQDGDGYFNIYTNANGPDLYVRQQEIKEFANLFNPQFSQNGIEPFIPIVDDPFDIEFDVNDSIVDNVSKWFQSTFSDKKYPENVSFKIYGSDGYGTLGTLDLS